MDEFPNLKSINISGTKIQLTVNNESPTKLTATNMKSGSKIDISNVSTLTDVSISGELTSLNIPSWKNNIVLPTTYTSSNNASWSCNSITITNDQNKYPDNTLTIRNNKTLASLSFSGFKNVYVYNCPNLNTISINDTDVLAKLYISGATPTNTSAKSFKIGTVTDVADLSKQSKLSELYLRNMMMETIKMPNRTVNLLDSAFYGCDRLKYIEGSGKYLITGANTFYNCSNWGYRQREDVEGEEPVFANIFVSSSCTTLNSTFYITNTSIRGAIDLSAANYFLTECTKNNADPLIGGSKVTNINNLFRNQNIEYPIALGFDEYKSGTCSLPLGNFSKADTINGVFYDCRVDFYNKYMFKDICSAGSSIKFDSLMPIGELPGRTPSDAEDTRGVWRVPSANASPVKVIYATIDMLEFIAGKMSQIVLANGPTDTIRLCFVTADNASNTDSTTGIVGLSLVETVVLGDLFRGGGGISPKLLREIGGIEVFSSHILDLSNCFSNDWSSIQPTSTRGLILRTFLEYDTYNNVLHVDGLFNEVSVESITTSLNNFTAKTDDNSGYIDIASFINFGIDDDEATKAKRLGKMTTLFGGHDYPSISSLKKKISYEDFQSIWANILKYATKLTGLYKLFSNCIITTTSAPEEFSLVDESLYTGVPNTSLVNIDYLFQNCKLRNRVSATTDLPFAITHDFLKFLPNIKSAKMAFTGMLWNNPIPFDFFRKREETINNVYVGANRKLAQLITYSYRKEITDLNECFANITMSKSQCFKPYDEYNKSSFKKNRIVTYDTNGDETDEGVEYYESPTSGRKITISQPTEITDAENINSNYVQRFTISIAGSTHTLANLQNTKSDGCFVSTDIFYGVSSGGCDLLGCFRNTSLESVCFTGVIPDHLLTNCINTPITNLMQGLNITPKLYKTASETDHEGNIITSHYYYYVPIHFTESTTLNNAFNFNFIIPPVSTDYNKYYYCVLLNGDNEKSISVATTSLSNALPGSGSIYRGINGQPSGFPQYCADDSGVYYAIMGSPIEELVDDELIFTGMDWGLDLNAYPDLKLDNIYHTPNMYFMIGNVIKEGTLNTWDKRLLSDSANVFIMTDGGPGAGGISINARIEPPLYVGSGYLRISGTGSKNINTNSIIGYDPNNLDYYKAYYPGFNVY